jgi:hypothetical protein
MAYQERSTSPWVYIGIGCLAAFLVLVAVIAGLGYIGYRTVRGTIESLEDPVARASAASRILGTDEIPAGYYPMVGMSIPFLVETAVLSDNPPDESGMVHGFNERGFIYVKTLRFGDQEQELRDFFDGKIEDPEALRQFSIDLDVDEMLDRGSFEEPGRILRWASYRGEVAADDPDSGGRQRKRGLNAMVLIECPDDERLRFGIWFGPDPDPEAQSGSPALVGTPADPAAIQEFMGHFDVCSQ